MKDYLLKIISNLGIIFFASLLAAFCNKNLGEYSEMCIISVVICTITTLITINKKSIKEINKDHFNASLSNISIILSNTLIQVDEYLTDEELFPTLDNPIVIDEKKHPILFCHKFVTGFINRFPTKTSEEEKDYTDLITIIKEHDDKLYKEIVLAHGFEENDQELLKSLKSIHSQLKKIQKKPALSQKELYKELNKLSNKVLSFCEFIQTTYPQYIEKYKP